MADEAAVLICVKVHIARIARMASTRESQEQIVAPPLDAPHHGDVMSQQIDAQFAREFLHRLRAAANAHNADAVAALCCDDVIWEDPAAPETLYGRDAVLRFHRDTMFPALPDTRIDLIDGPYLALDGSSVAARLHISGTMTGTLTPPGFAPTDGPVSFETAEFSHFRDGLLARHTVVLNMLDLARQIGAVPRAGTLGDRIGVWLQHVSAFCARARKRSASTRDGGPSRRSP
jgi:predicted ester cyclase